MIKIRVFHTGSVCVSPALPFGGNEKNPLKASPIFTRKKDRLWLPVSSYLIEHPKGKVLFDCGWHRDMSPNGEFDKKAQIRYQSKWWDGCDLESFDWNDTEGPFGKAYDVFGDGSVKMIAIPGHSNGLCVVKIKNEDGKYVLLFADGGYATKSWKEMITSGVCEDKAAQIKSLEWIREQSMSEDCIESLVNHDADVIPHNICL